MQRSLWKGAISFGLVHIPVQMFSAEDRGHELDLTMLDKRDLAPIGYKRVNKDTGKEVDWDDIVKGYEYEKDRFVVLSPEDLRRANVEATRTVDILTFVDAGEVPAVYFEHPYYLTPDKGGENREDVLALAQRKIKANQTRLITPPEADEEAPARGDNIVDPMALLRESVNSRGKPAAKKAPAKKAAHHEPARKTRARA